MYLYGTIISVPIRVMTDELHLKHEPTDNFLNKVLQKCLTTTIRKRRLMLIMAATEPIRDKNQLKSLADYYLHRGRFAIIL